MKCVRKEDELADSRIDGRACAQVNPARLEKCNVRVNCVIPQPVYIWKMFNIKLLEEVEYFANLNALNKLGSYAIHEIKIQNGEQVKSCNYKTYGMSREEQWSQP